MDELARLGEFGLIARFARLAGKKPELIEGIGDDCAVARFGKSTMLLTCDLSIENVHFNRRYMSGYDIGWKAAAAAVSDIAAMGGTPRFLLAALACPPETDAALLEEIFLGVRAVARSYGIVIAGGDTTRSDSGICLDISVIGEAIGGRYRTRSGLRNGDMLFVTGPLGLSRAGLHALERNAVAPKPLLRAHLHPKPRIDEGQFFARQRSVRAMMDLSDGLAQDAQRLCERSGVGVDLQVQAKMASPALKSYCAFHGLDPASIMLQGGEDYELLVGVSARGAEALTRKFQERFGRRLLPVGRATKDWAGVRVQGAAPSVRGFDHFKRD